MRRQEQALRSEISLAAEALDNDKTGRGHLGDLLVEMGTRLKQQVGLADLVDQIGRVAEQPPQ
jgi:hypothetical protein